MKRKNASIQPDLFEQDEPPRLARPLTEGTAGNTGRSPAVRDRGGAGKREGRR